MKHTDDFNNNAHPLWSVSTDYHFAAKCLKLKGIKRYLVDFKRHFSMSVRHNSTEIQPTHLCMPLPVEHLNVSRVGFAPALVDVCVCVCGMERGRSQAPTCFLFHFQCECSVLRRARCYSPAIWRRRWERRTAPRWACSRRPQRWMPWLSLPAWCRDGSRERGREIPCSLSLWLWFCLRSVEVIFCFPLRRERSLCRPGGQMPPFLAKINNHLGFPCCTRAVVSFLYLWRQGGARLWYRKTLKCLFTATVVCHWPNAPFFSLWQARCLSPPPPCSFSSDKANTFLFFTVSQAPKCLTDAMSTEAQDSCRY